MIARYMLQHNKKSKLKLFFLTFIKFFDDQLRDAFDGNKSRARQYYPLIVGMFFIILFGNLFGLVVDWFGLSVVPGLLYVMRPIHSDLNTTLVLALITVVYMLKIQITTQGVGGTLKSYLFDFRGGNFLEKCIGVFVGWLHAIGVIATTASLSLRLFGNIFAGIILI
jgi:F0F1-type ATP synthase membrane subunit a